MKKGKWFVFGLLLAGTVIGYAITRMIVPSPDEKLAEQLAQATLEKQEAYEAYFGMQNAYEAVNISYRASLASEIETVRVESKAKVQQVMDARGITDVIVFYERNRSNVNKDWPYDKITVLDEFGARIPLTELQYMTITNISYTECVSILGWKDQQILSYVQSLKSYDDALGQSQDWLKKCNAQLADCQKSVIPEVPLIKGLFLRGAVYSDFKNSIFDMQSKIYTFAIGTTFQTRDVEARILGGVGIYPVNEVTQRYIPQSESYIVETNETSRSKFGFGLEFDWYFLH